MRKQPGEPGEKLLMLDRRGRLSLKNFLFPGSDNRMFVYCVDDGTSRSRKFCIKIVSIQHPSASYIWYGTIVHVDARVRISIPKQYIRKAELVPGGKVLVTQAYTGSNLEVWLPENYDLEWKTVLEEAGIETTL